MRVSELSAATGVTIPTLKFYLREGLLPPGERVAANQSAYGEWHVRRVRLIRALTEVGRLSLREVRRILEAVENTSVPIHDLLGTAQYALEPDRPDLGAAEHLAEARAIVDSALARLGWGVNEGAPARETLAGVVATLQELGWQVTPAQLLRYGRAIDRLAEREVADSAGSGGREELLERMVIGSVLYEAILAAFRRLAHEHHSAKRPK